jgi:hypothetical protein
MAQKQSNRYANPFAVQDLDNLNNDPNVHIYPKIEVEDHLTRIIKGKDPRYENVQGNAYANINEQIAQQLLDANGRPLKMLNLKPSVSPKRNNLGQQFVPHLNLGKFYKILLEIIME